MKHINRYSVYTAGIAICALSLSSCSNTETAETPVPAVDVEQVKSQRASAEKIFYSIPAPMEMTGLMKRAGAGYDKTLLNDPQLKEKYSTINTRALNLGVYGADLSYATIFDNTQEALLFLSATKSLADGLGITDAFDAETVDRLETNMDNRDSMLTIISNSFMKTDDYLQENDRGSVSALIIAGGWLETTYLATQTERKLQGSSEELKRRIAEQKFSLGNLIEYLNHYQNDATVSTILTDLNKLNDVYSQVSIQSEAGDTSTDTVNNITTIGGTTSVSITDDQLEAISSIVSTARNRIINAN